MGLESVIKSRDVDYIDKSIADASAAVDAMFDTYMDICEEPLAKRRHATVALLERTIVRIHEALVEIGGVKS